MSVTHIADFRKLFLQNEFTDEYFKICASPYIGKGERHHILPTSVYPEYTKCKWNIVNLSFYNHYKAHELLPFMVDKDDKNRRSYLAAWNIMKHLSNGEVIDSTRYAELKIDFKIMMGTITSKRNKGRPLTEDHKKNIAKGMVGEKNHFYGKTHNYTAEERQARAEAVSKQFKGKPKSEDTRRKMSEAQKGKIVSDESKAKMSIAQRGKVQTEEHVTKRILAIQTAPRLTCPHCGLTGAPNNLRRYHFSNCKKLEEPE